MIDMERKVVDAVEWVIRHGDVFDAATVEDLCIEEEVIQDDVGMDSHNEGDGEVCLTRSSRLPRKPYSKEIAQRLYQWYTKRDFPVHMPTCDLLVEVGDEVGRVSSMTQAVVDALDTAVTGGSYEQLKQLMASLGRRGILTLLGLRNTAGSVDMFPPSHAQLFHAFQQRHTPIPTDAPVQSTSTTPTDQLQPPQPQPQQEGKERGSDHADTAAGQSQPQQEGKERGSDHADTAAGQSQPQQERSPYPKKKRNVVSELTVGARALSKHAGRSSDAWWGVPKGPERVKNEMAKEVLRRILSSVVWVNIHMLPHDTPVLEVRNDLGYGLRWGVKKDYVHFRGFLEPQMEDGHEKGWQH